MSYNLCAATPLYQPRQPTMPRKTHSVEIEELLDPQAGGFDNSQVEDVVQLDQCSAPHAIGVSQSGVSLGTDSFAGDEQSTMDEERAPTEKTHGTFPVKLQTLRL